MKFKLGALWPVAIVGVLALTVGANIWVMVVARDPHAAAIEPDYYNKAVAWDSTLAEQHRSEQLAWTAEVELLDASTTGATVRVLLRDRGRQSVAGARVSVEAIHNLQADERIRATLGELRNGEYSARMPLRRRGLWELRIEATRGRDRWVTSVRREAQWSSTAR